MPRSTKEQSEVTARRLVTAAWELFAERGFAAVALEEVAARADVTRGAVYHHFGSKIGVFRAVHAQVQEEVGEAIDRATASIADPRLALEIGCRAFLEASVHDRVRQVMLVDAPVVLGWDAWRQQDAGASGRRLRDVLAELARAGALDGGSVEAYHALLSGAMNEAALWAASTADPQVGVAEAWTLLRHMLDAVAPRVGPHGQGPVT